jgi:hypothetical protein
MAAVVTVNTGWPRTNVTGSMRTIMAEVTVTSTSDWWVSGLRTIKALKVQHSGAAGAHPISATVSGGTVTFLTDGTADAAVFVEATGW